MTNTYIIINKSYESTTHKLLYKTGGGVPGSFEITEDNTILLDKIQYNTFMENDTLIFDLGNIESMEQITTCLTKRIKTSVDVIIYVSKNPSDSTFDLDDYEFISSFTVRIPESSPLTSAISVNLNNCSKLTSIDCDRFLLSSISANNCPMLTGTLDLQYCGDNLKNINAGYDKAPETLGGITGLSISDSQSIETIYIPYTSISSLPDSGNILTSLKTLDISGCSNVKRYDFENLSALEYLYANNSGLEGNLRFNNTIIKELYLSGCSEIESLTIFTDGDDDYNDGVMEVLDISNTKLVLYFTLDNDIFIEKPIINMSSNTGIEILNIEHLDLTNITYPKNFNELNLAYPIYDKLMDLTHFEKLEAFALDYCDNITNIKFPSNIQVIQIANCPNLLKNQTFTIPQTTTFCSLNTCSFSSIVYNYSGENSPLAELQLYNLGNCKSIKINNANYYSEEPKTTFLLMMLTNGESTYQSILDLSSFINLSNLSITNSNISSVTGITSNDNKNSAIRTINLSNSTTKETLNIDFEQLPSIETLNLSNCETLKKINNNGNYNFMLANYGSLKYLYLDGTQLNDINITNTNVVSNLNTLILPSEMIYLDIDGCKKLNNDYLADVNIKACLKLSNLGYNYPKSLSNITDAGGEPINISINNTTWTNIILNGKLLKNEDNIIYIEHNKNLKSISFTNPPPLDEINSLEIGISYNLNLKTINGRSDIKDILDFFNREPISLDNISQLNYNFCMNAFKYTDNLEYMGIWPQVEEWDGLSGRIYGIPTYDFKDSGIYDEYVGINSRSTNRELIKFSLNNITLWDSGNYSTSEVLSTLTFRNSLSLFFDIDENGNVLDDSVVISDNNNSTTESLIDIINGLLSNDDIEKPKIIYTNSKTLKGIASNYNIPVQMLHITGENWKPRFVININLVSNE